MVTAALGRHHTRRRVALLGALAIGGALLAVVTQPARPVHAATTAPSPVISAVSRSADKLDIFGVDTQQRIYTAAWEPGFTDGWHRWTQLNGGLAAPGTSVYAVSRRTDYLDVFAVGTDRRVYTAAWQPGFTDGWHGWWQLGSLTVAPGTSVHAVSSRTDRIDVFAIGSDLGIYTTGWSPSTGWASWTRINGGAAAANTTVFGVSRARGKLDIFAVGTDRQVYTAAWDDAAPGWRGWWPVKGFVVAPQTSVFPVSRRTDYVDIFAVASNRQIYTASWQPSFTDGWHGWWAINGGVAAPNTSVFGVSRRTDNLDIFAVGTDQRVYTAAWQPSFTDGWHGWWQVNGGVTAPNTSVLPVSRGTDKLDIFAVGTDNGTWTAAWEPAFTDGWHGWWGVGNPLSSGTLNSIILRADIRFNNGVPVGGWASLSLFPDGSFNFSGHFHDSGFPSYDTGIVWVVRSSAGTAFVFSDKGHVAGTVEPGSRNHDWNISGTNPAIRAAWPDLQAGYNWQWNARTSLDIASIYNGIKAGIGAVTAVVQVVGLL